MISLRWTRAGRPARPALVSEGEARRPDRRRLYRRALQPFARLDGRPGARLRRRQRRHQRPIPIAGRKGRHAGIRHRLRLLRSAQLHCAFAAAGKVLSPTARDWSQPCRQAGFRNYSHEWWHFTLKNEPYQASSASTSPSPTESDSIREDRIKLADRGVPVFRAGVDALDGEAAAMTSRSARRNRSGWSRAHPSA